MISRVTFKLEEKSTPRSEDPSYEEVLEEVDSLPCNSHLNGIRSEYISMPMADRAVAMRLNYSTNFRRKDLVKIANYYQIPTRKMRKTKLIRTLVDFEEDPTNILITTRRRLLWYYLDELQADSYLSRFIIFD